MGSFSQTVASTDQEGVIAGDPQQAQSYHQHAGDGAALEGDIEGSVQAFLGSFSGADIGTHGDVHADESRRTREQGAYCESDGSLPAQRCEDDGEQYQAYDGDGEVLPCEVGGGAFLYRSGDFTHSLAAGRAGQYPFD